MLAIAAASFSLTANANVITINFDFQSANDGSNLNSPLLDFDKQNFNQLGLPGGTLFWEDFDTYSQNGPSECGFTALGQNVNLGAGVSGSYSLTKGLTPGQAAPPAGDNTCFLVTPEIGGAAPGSVDFGLGPLLTSDGGFELDYLGLYWGSIDGGPNNTDSIQFFDANNDVMSFQYTDSNNVLVDLGDVITGDELLKIFNGKTGDQQSEESNLYVNFYMEDSGFNNFVLASTGKALEIDNIVARAVPVRPVSAPGTLALLSVSLIGLALSRKKCIK